jgi:uncharacterized membrane protein
VNRIGADSEPPEERQFDYDRTVALSDGVFAIALTLLVLTITTPHVTPGHESELASRLLDRSTEFRSYVISFAVIGIMWIRHHSFFRELERIDARLTGLNLLYLGLVAFLPYPTNVLGAYGDEPAAAVFYAITVGLVATVAGVMRVHALRSGLTSEAGRRRLEAQPHWALVPAVFALSIPIAFIDPVFALISWLAILVVRARR